MNPNPDRATSRLHGKGHGLAPTYAAAAILLVAAVALLSPPAYALKITTWNLLDYDAGTIAGRQANFRLILQNLDTDVLMVEEMKSQAGADSFYNNVLRVANPSKNWQRAGFLTTNPATESEIYYVPSAVSVGAPAAIANPSGPRNFYQLVLTPVGYTTNASKIVVFSIHFKAGNTAADSATRRLECTTLRNTLNSRGASFPNLLLGGDTNFYGDWEGGYQVLLQSQSNNNGRMKDLFSMPGTWNQFAYRCYHTQSPCVSGCPDATAAGGSGGGLDDRFDLFVSSYGMQNGTGVELLSSIAYGNDCNHYNSDINFDERNDAVPIAVADALHDASDHIPEIATLQLPPRIAADSQLDFGSSITGANVTRTLSVANAATLLPAETLSYSLSAPAGFGAPGGGFSAAPGAAANLHTIAVNQTPAHLTGTLAIASNAVDSLTKNVLLSATVLAHAQASLDSAQVVTSGSATLGNHPGGGFSDLPIAVYNRGWSSLQARLSVATATVSSASGRFSIAGGFNPALVSGSPLMIPIHFDDSGAAPNQDYSGTLTLSSADEALPGAAAQPDLVIQLYAHVSSPDAGVGDAIPRAIAFLPPRPNPFSRATTLRFELPHRAPVAIEIFDLSGRRVISLFDGVREAGRYDVPWNGTDLGGARVVAGLYFARFTTPGLESKRRIVVLP